MYSKLCALRSIIILGLAIFVSGPVAAQRISQTFTSSGTFTVPAGVTKIDIEAWGGGGGGAGGSSVVNETSGGGGGGGAYVKITSMTVTPGQEYTITVGVGGTGGTNASFDGKASSVSIGSIIIIEAEGGKGGTNATSSVPGMGGAGGKGTYNGGNGASGVNGFSGFGGGGGSSGGINQNGNDGSSVTGGEAVSGGGKGGNGGLRGQVGLSGSEPGGGGGGGSRATINRAGGNGASGQVVISWTTCAPPVIEANSQPNSQSIVYGSSASFSVVASGEGALSYQWEVSTSANPIWVALSDNNIYSGTNSATLELSRPPVSMSGNKYRVVVSGCTPVQTATSNGLATLQVNKAELYIINESSSKAYGEELTSTSFSGSISGLVPGDDIRVERSSPGEVASTSAGTYPIVAQLLDPDGRLSNYEVYNPTGLLTITRIPLIITASNTNKIYDGIAYNGGGVTYSGFVNNESAAVLTGTLAYSGTAQGAINVGSYSIAPEGLRSDNYDISYVSGSLTINPRTITVTANAQSKTYGDADLFLSFSVTSGSLMGEDAFAGGLLRTQGENVGVYAIERGNLSAGDNYVVTFVSASFTIAPRAASVKPSANSKVYRESDPPLTGELSGFLATDAVTATYFRTPGETVLDGPYTISGTLSPTAVLSNYEITYHTAAFDILPKQVKVTADAKKKMAGDTDPELTFTFNDETVKPEDFNGSLERAHGEVPGEYVIQKGTLALNDNYKIEYIPAALRIYEVPAVALSITDPVMVNNPSIINVGHSGEVFHAKWIYTTASTCQVQEVIYEENGKLTNAQLHLVSSAPLVYAVSMYYKNAVGQEFTTPPVYAVFYDPNAGFVTGGGWITSPTGAFKWNPAATGKANFGFVAKYKKGSATGTLEGETEFQFQAGNLKFQSTSYEAATLVIGGYKASYKGFGTINGTGLYKFTLVATDGQVTGGGGIDKIRMKITSLDGIEVIYDNQGGFAGTVADNADPITALGGGSIMIHIPPVGGKKTSDVSAEAHYAEVIATAGFNVKAFPNPSTSSFNLQLESDNLKDKINIRIVDLYGRTVEVIKGASSQQILKIGATYTPGIYFVEMIQGSRHKQIKLLKQGTN
jgi:hypothetical protein